MENLHLVSELYVIFSLVELPPQQMPPQSFQQPSPQPYPPQTQSYPPQPYPSQPTAPPQSPPFAQAYPPQQPYPGQPYPPPSNPQAYPPQQPYPGQPFPAQPYPGQPFPQAYPPQQPYPGQPVPPPQQSNQLAFFAHVKGGLDRDYTVIIDKSGSMHVADNGPSRWVEAHEAVACLADAVTQADPDGVCVKAVFHVFQAESKAIFSKLLCFQLEKRGKQHLISSDCIVFLLPQL